MNILPYLNTGDLYFIPFVFNFVQWSKRDPGSTNPSYFIINFTVSGLTVIPVVQESSRNSGYDRNPFRVTEITDSYFRTGSQGDRLVWLAIGH